MDRLAAHNRLDQVEILRLLSEAYGEARRGAELVGQVLDSAAEVAADPRRTRDIAAAIDSIALQIGLLGLEATLASVRFARHADAWTALASEIHALARQCSDAAKQIRRAVRTGESLIARATCK